ncbi:hypothetical protein NEOLEDRAFT_1089957 [Neolentinus lepideus HHB14362 ss-1]|uniref:Translation initiation factor 3 N-terminal domain-containing protein n=1 Tax=Neolentinus lepideus HHB14362 ss-1 TaxID=1314782 RepID=A0A165TRJ1_9AGAM|nr:hypothetical protein NEOLEDRAFT_1089957 [Neolentinus lepideus HHB14362 ss-1]
MMFGRATSMAVLSVNRAAGPVACTSRIANHVIRPGNPPCHLLRRANSGVSGYTEAPKNDKIPHRVVRLVDPETSKLLAPAPLEEVLVAFDHKKFFLQLVSEHPEPIVKLIDKNEARKKRLAERKQALLNKREEKEIQLTWKIANGDLLHKLKKVRQELEKGNRVDLVYAPKKGQVLPSPEEKDDIVRDTLRILEDIGREWKPREQAPRMTVVYLEKKKEI